MDPTIERAAHSLRRAGKKGPANDLVPTIATAGAAWAFHNAQAARTAWAAPRAAHNARAASTAWAACARMGRPHRAGCSHRMGFARRIGSAHRIGCTQGIGMPALHRHARAASAAPWATRNGRASRISMAARAARVAHATRAARDSWPAWAAAPWAARAASSSAAPSVGPHGLQKCSKNVCFSYFWSISSRAELYMNIWHYGPCT